MALALLTQPWCTARGIALTTLTVDHGLRAESASEAQQVAQWMRAHGIAHHTLTTPLQPAIRNPQTQARVRRYEALLAECHARGITHLLLGHHADDQAETVALQRHRGESPPSRAGMALVSERGAVQLLRPLLGTRKAALLDYLRAANQPWLDDPSNASDAYARNRLRKTLSEPEIIALWHEAQVAGAARHAQEIARNAWMTAHAKPNETGVILPRPAWLGLPSEQQTDYLSHAIRIVGAKQFRPRMTETQRLTHHIAAGNPGAATLGHCQLRWHAAEIRIAPEMVSSRPLDASPSQNHMPSAMVANNPLVSRPFCWFKFPLNH